MTIHIPKIHDCITFTNSFIAYHKTDLEVLTVATVCSIFESDYQIERYRMIKFAWFACILFRKNQPHMISLNYF